MGASTSLMCRESKVPKRQCFGPQVHQNRLWPVRATTLEFAPHTVLLHFAPALTSAANVTWCML